MSEANRRQIQEALSGLGYYKGPVEGIFGRGTRTAICHFQRDITRPAGRSRDGSRNGRGALSFRGMERA